VKILKQFQSESDAKFLAERFRNKGILTFISSVQSRKLSSLYTGAFTSVVWVVLESQYSDAFLLLEFKQHKVEHPLSEQEMQELEEQGKISFSETIQNSASTMLNYVFGTILLVIVSVALFSYFSNS
jgi:uncharacterized protein YqhQ